MTAAPMEQARRLAEFLDGRMDHSSPSPIVAKMADVCDPTLRRNHQGAGSGHLDADQASLYEFLRLRVTDPDATFEDRFPVPAGWRQVVMDEEAGVLEEGPSRRGQPGPP